MNTAQLIVLWYAGLLIMGVLVLQAGSASESTTGYWVAVIILGAGLLIYSFRPHPSARKWLVLAAVAGPLVALPVGFAAWFYYQRAVAKRHERIISPAEIEISDAQLHGRYGSTYLRGRVRNKSGVMLDSLSLEVTVFEGGDVIERKTISTWEDIPPGEARDVEVSLAFSTEVWTSAGFDKRYGWQYRVLEIKGRVPDSR